MAKGNPDSFLHISRSEIDLPETEMMSTVRRSIERKRISKKKSLIRACSWKKAGLSLYIYRQEMDGRSQTGIVGCVSIDEYRDNTIKKNTS